MTDDDRVRPPRPPRYLSHDVAIELHEDLELAIAVVAARFRGCGADLRGLDHEIGLGLARVVSRYGIDLLPADADRLLLSSGAHVAAQHARIIGLEAAAGAAEARIAGLFAVLRSQGAEIEQLTALAALEHATAADLDTEHDRRAASREARGFLFAPEKRGRAIDGEGEG